MVNWYVTEGLQVCHRTWGWSLLVGQLVGLSTLISRTSGDMSTLPAALCALSMVKKLMLYLDNFSALLVFHEMKRVDISLCQMNASPIDKRAYGETDHLAINKADPHSRKNT